MGKKSSERDKHHEAKKHESEDSPIATSVQEDGVHYEQAAVVPYRWIGPRLYIYLIKTLKKKHWIVPKGLVENDQSQIEAVVLETFEEAGLIGVVCETPIGFHQTRKWEGVCDITVYPMKVLVEVDFWPEHDLRKRILVDYQEGSWRTLVDDPGLLSVLEQFGSTLDPSSNPEQVVAKAGVIQDGSSESTESHPTEPENRDNSKKKE